MSYTVRWDRKAKEFLKRLDKTNAQRITRNFCLLKNNSLVNKAFHTLLTIKKANSILNDPRHYIEFLVDIGGYKLRID